MKSLRIVVLVLFVLVLLVFGRSFASSGFFQKTDRVNIMFYGERPLMYSIGKGDGIDYAIGFYPDLKISVAGGYGTYRVGAVGKLTTLEKKPSILQRTFSFLSSYFVNYYFYPSSVPVYFGKGGVENAKAPGLKDVFFSLGNASLVDRLYIAFLLFQNPKSQFKELPFSTREEFAKNYLGYFYDTTYRNEKQSVQIIYTKSAKTASFIGQTLEGEGIKVADITESTNEKGGCEVVYDQKTQTSSDLSRFFGCRSRKGETGAYDILFMLGGLEDEWEVT